MTDVDSTPSTPSPRTSALREAASRLAADWRGTIPAVRFYAAGVALIAAGTVLLAMGVPNAVIATWLLAGATLASAGFVLEVYLVVDAIWETKPGKLAGILLATMVASFAMALASVIVNEATGIDPGHFPLTVAFMAPLTAAYIVAILALVAVVLGMVWLVGKTFVDAARLGWAKAAGQKLAHFPGRDGLRFIAVVMMLLLLAVVSSKGQKPYEAFLTGTARWFTYQFEMYGTDPCREPPTRVRRLNDEIVAFGVLTPNGPVFGTRRCELGVAPYLYPKAPAPRP